MRRFLSKLVPNFRSTTTAPTARPSRRSAWKNRAIVNVEALETRDLMTVLTGTVLAHAAPSTLIAVSSNPAANTSTHPG
jgi:hypothetical protein